MQSTAWQEAKNKAQHLYINYPGFSGVGGVATDSTLAIVLLFFDTIPEDIITEMDGIPILAKKWF